MLGNQFVDVMRPALAILEQGLQAALPCLGQPQLDIQKVLLFFQ